MATRPIVKYPLPLLQKKTAPVTLFDDDLVKLVSDMIETMREAPGVGLAAPQIGVSLRLAVIAGSATLPDEARENESETPPPPPLVLANPRIVAGEGAHIDEEGCLSVIDCFAKVKRYQKITVEAQDIKGLPLRFEANGFFARVIQHEVDHLDGTLFIDRLSSLKRGLYKKKLKKILAQEQEAGGEQ